MLLKLIGLLFLSFVLLLLPQARSSRPRFVTPHTHGLPHHAASSSQSSLLTTSQLQELPQPQIQMVTGSNEKHSQYADFDIAMVTALHHQKPDQLGGMLDTPVSGPNPGGNSESLAASSGQNLLGDTDMVAVPLHHQAPDLGGMLDTPVSGPNPGGNSESLTVSNRQNLLGDMLDTPVSGPNPGGNSESLLVSGPYLGGSSNTITSMLDTPVSGPSPSGNSNTLGNMLDTPVSGPNPGGNSQNLFVSGPNSRGSSAKGLANKLENMLNTAVSGPNPRGNSATLGDILDTPVSGPNPGSNSQILSAALGLLHTGGNSQILATSSGPNPGGNSEILAASSGPNPGGNSESLVSSDGQILSGGMAGQFFAASAGPIGERDSKPKLSAVSGPNPGGNSVTLGSNLSKKIAQVGTSAGSSMSEKADADTLFGKLPKTPVPPSGPSPIHNTAVINQGLFVARSLKGSFIGCEQEGERDSVMFQHYEAYGKPINDHSNMEAPRLTTA